MSADLAECMSTRDLADYDWAHYGEQLVLFGPQHFPVLVLKAGSLPLDALASTKHAFVSFLDGGGRERGESFLARL